jgi:hypothetical protein
MCMNDSGEVLIATSRLNHSARFTSPFVRSRLANHRDLKFYSEFEPNQEAFPAVLLAMVPIVLMRVVPVVCLRV